MKALAKALIPWLVALLLAFVVFAPGLWGGN